MSPGRTMHCQVTGTGDTTLVLLHFFGSGGGVWQPLQLQLESQIRCVTPDLPGFGGSAGMGGPFTVAAYADRVRELIAAECPGPYVLAGHSMGGKIAMSVAGSAPPGLSGLVLLAPSPPTPEPISDTDRADLRKLFGRREGIAAHLRRISNQRLTPTVLDAEVGRQLRSGEDAWNAWLDTGSREDISAQAAGITVPALLLSGADDTCIAPDLVLREVASRLVNVTHRTFAGTGHLLPLEQPQQVAAAIRSWMSPL